MLANYDHPRPGDEVPGGLAEFLDPAGGQLWSPHTFRVRILPTFWTHVSDDHAVTTQLLPAGPSSTRAVVSWLVHPDAVEGVDYRLDRLLPFWQLTSEQDWEICHRQQRGVRSAGYRPGPLSPSTEHNVANLHAWYLRQMAP